MRPGRGYLRPLLILILAPTLGSASFLIPLAHPARLPISKRTDQTWKATSHFWNAFRDGRYSEVNAVLKELTEAEHANPDDPVVTLLLGMTHNWKAMERARDALPPLVATEHAMLGLHYCQRAQQLDPSNRINPGFIETGRWAVGVLTNNPGMVAEAEKGLRRNRQTYPQFHGFMQGWVMSAMLRHDDPRYEEAIEGFFDTFDHCGPIPLPRIFPRVGPVGFTLLAHFSRCKTACYNSDIAPHNLEGTFLALGDAYLKKGDRFRAEIAYGNITSVPSYPYWPYREQLRHRLENLEVLVQKFQADSGKLNVCEPAMLFQSCYACSACHGR